MKVALGRLRCTSTSCTFKLIGLLKFLFQVPADGILISGHSLAIDESSMTGEAKIVSFCILFPLLIFIS